MSAPSSRKRSGTSTTGLRNPNVTGPVTSAETRTSASVLHVGADARGGRPDAVSAQAHESEEQHAEAQQSSGRCDREHRLRHGEHAAYFRRRSWRGRGDHAQRHYVCTLTISCRHGRIAGMQQAGQQHPRSARTRAARSAFSAWSTCWQKPTGRKKHNDLQTPPQHVVDEQRRVHGCLRRRVISSMSSRDSLCSSTRCTSRGSADPLNTRLTNSRTMPAMTLRLGCAGR